MMAAELGTPRAKRGWKFLGGMALGGGVAGYLFGFFFADQIDGMLGGPDPDPSRFAAFLVALIYGVTALAVLVGLVNPKIGARFLNVEDAEELIEQRRQLALSGISMLAVAGILLLLAFSAPAGPVAPATALIGCVVLLTLMVAVSLRMNTMIDELMQAVSRDAATWGFYLLAGAGGLWAICAHLGFASAPEALDWVTGTAAALLIGAFIAVGRRGMLALR